MRIIELDNVESTNSYAKASVDMLDDKTVIIAKSQSAGRGRLARSWVDLGEGNLFMSVILKPSEVFDEKYSNLTQYLSVVLCKVLETYGVNPQIKWPNDVLIDGKKIAGILSESIIHSKGKLEAIILGIGVNLNAKQSDVDNIPNKIATALNLEIGESVDLKEFIKKLSDEFFAHYDEFLEKGFELIREDYINKSNFLNKEISVQVFNRIENGLAKEIDTNGGLVLLTKDDRKTVLTIGDIL
ncbi:MAG: biotin--[acetyl-CoA-carboxylase] ligase [Candidatus Gastranaerophilaceae bacterium]